MTTITKLEEIDVYKESLVLAREIYSLTRNPKIQKDYSLIDQIRRASLSVPANIAEGFGRKTKRDFAQFLSVSLGSTNEVIAFLDFIQLEYNLDCSVLKEKFSILAKRIFSFRTYLLSHNH
jgi:four helix bundle protein